MRWCWVNFQYRDVLLIWLIVGQGPTALSVGAGGGCLDIFTLLYLFSPLSPSLWETARYRLKYCLKGPLNPKQPTNQSGRTEVEIPRHMERLWAKTARGLIFIAPHVNCLRLWRNGAAENDLCHIAAENDLCHIW